jgi:hypothetical protein
MTTLLAFVFMLVIVAVMSVGVMMGRKPIAGSCGGMSALGMKGECQVCGRIPGSCEGSAEGLSRIPDARRQAQSLATDASDTGRPNARTL